MATSSRTSRLVWYRSLLWRTAFAFVIALLGTAAAQAALMLWLIDRAAVESTSTPSSHLHRIARQVSAALDTDPSLDVIDYIRRADIGTTPPFAVVLQDGRVTFAGGGASALAREAGWPRPGVARADPAGSDPSMSPRLPGPARMMSVVEIRHDGQLVGVIVQPRPPLLGRLWWPALGRALLLVVLGTGLAALLVFRPLSRRVGNLADTARRIGAGDLNVRATVAGRDEIADFARTFNQMATDLQERTEQVVAAERTRRVLLADVSHELRTPITTMIGYLDTLELSRESIDRATAARYLGVVHQEARRLQRVVNDLLDLATLEGGGLVLDLQHVAIEHLFGRVVARFELEAEAHQVSLLASVDPGAEIVLGDEGRLEQALQNLVANAIRYSAPSTTIRIRSEHAADEIRVSVADAGAGIPADHLPFVFDRFYKVDGARTQDSTGSGLGLSIVKAIAERHGGRVTVSSEGSLGSTFTLHLPNAEG